MLKLKILSWKNPQIYWIYRHYTARFSALYEKPFELIDHTGRVTVPFWMKVSAEELVDNSFKFNDKVKLVLEVTALNGGLKFEDNGPGIPFEERKKVFEPFYQVYKSFSGNTAGAGLGLSIVKKMCESNGVLDRDGAGR